MTDKQLAFVNAYIGDAHFNATEAARLAKYANPNQQGWRIKQDPEVAAAIKERLDQQTLAANETLSILSDHARGSLEDFLDIDGVAVRPDLAKAKKAGKMHLLKTYKYSRKSGVEIQLYDAQAAAVQMGKHHGLFTEKIEATVHDSSALESLKRKLAGFIASDAPEAV